MVGLLLKDYYQTFCIRKNLISFIFGFLLLYGVFFLIPNIYNVMLFVILCVPMMGVTPLQYATERDEVSQFDKILLTYPLTKQKIVLCKLISTYLFSVLSILTFSLPMIMLAVYHFHLFSLNDGLILLMVSSLCSFIVLPINNISFMLLGNRKGTIIYIVVTVFFLAAFITVYFWIGVEKLLLIPVSSWLMGGCLVAVVLNVFGYSACLKIYEREHR